MIRIVKRRIKASVGMDFFVKKQVSCRSERHGGNYGSWVICPGFIDSSSIVYSVGIGEDISFDISLIEKYGLTVHAFDPTPKSLNWIATQKVPAKFRMFDIGLADYDGYAEFILPSNKDHVSCSMIHTNEIGDETVKVKVKTLSTLMEMLGHVKIDLLKMDIEGAEYGVIDSIVTSNLEIGQILIEFHHRFKGVGNVKTYQALSKLNCLGYRIFHVSDNFEEISLIKT